MSCKKCIFPKLGTKTYQLGKKKKGGLTKEQWQKRIAKTLKENPLW